MPREPVRPVGRPERAHRRAGRIRRSLVTLVLTLGVLSWAVSGGLAAWQLTARPAEPRAERLPTWLAAEAVRIATRDGEELGAWFQPGPQGGGVAILLHGMGGSRSSLAPAAKRLEEAGHGFLAVSLRSFGDSSGGELDFGWSSRADVIAAVELVEQRSPGAPIVVIGQSLGAAAAIFAAPELGTRVAGYVLEAPYRDLDKACSDRLRLRLAAPLAWLAEAGLRLWAPLFLPVDRALVRPIDHVGHFPAGVPVLFVAGAQDRRAPLEDVAVLTERCNGAAELAILDGRDHDDLWELDGRHWELWAGLLERVERARAPVEPH
ncbi:MAG TPA: alpha/beta fold hydrolase [Planctomycetota bacterium]